MSAAPAENVDVRQSVRAKEYENTSCDAEAARMLTDTCPVDHVIMDVYNDSVAFISFDERSRKLSVNDQHLARISIRS